MKPVTVVLCCNDQHGNPEGCVRRIEVGESITLEAVALDRPPRIAFVQFDSLTRLLRISGKVFPVLSYRRCSPMAMTDAVAMEPAVVAALLNFLKKKGGFVADCGVTVVFEAWQSEGIQFSAPSLEAACSA